MVHETCYFASNYEEEIRSMGDPATMAAHTTVVQFPYTEAVSFLDLTISISLM
jgi:actin-related protein 5